MEKPLAFDPRGRVALTPSGEIVLTLLGENGSSDKCVVVYDYLS